MCCARVEPCSCLAAAEQLHRDLLAGMHALAQPLTMLESRLYLALAQPGPPSPTVDALVAMGADLRQLCGTFRLMQRLLQLQSTPALLEEVSVFSLGLFLREAAEVALAGLPIATRFDLAVCETDNATRQLLRLDRERMREAMMQLLCVAAESTGPEISLEARWADDEAAPGRTLALVIASHAGSGTQQRAQAADARSRETQQLHTAVAREGLRSQGCSLQITADLFICSVHVPCRC